MGQGWIDLGRQIANVAIPIQVYQLTRSSLMVGLVGLVQVAPLIFGALFGGSVADAVDRRRVLVTIQFSMALAGSGLLVNSLLDAPRLWPLFAIAALMALFHGADAPTRHSLVPRLVGPGQLSASFALLQLQRQTLQAAAPAVGGLVIAQFGVQVTFGVCIAAWLLAAATLIRLAPAPPVAGVARAGLSSIIEGFRYLRTRPILLGVFGVDFQAMVFSVPKALFPEFGTEVLGGNEATIGLLYSALGIGAMIGAATSGWITRLSRQGRAVMLCAAVWGVSLVFFSFSTAVWMAVAFLAIAGFADVVGAVLRVTVLHQTIPDEMRGRLSGVQTSLSTSSTRLGETTMGSIGSVVGPRLAMLGGGTAAVLGVFVFARLVPTLWRYEAPGRGPTDT